MNDIEISQRAREIERQFESTPRAAEFDLAQERLNTKDAHLLTGVPQDVSMEWETVAGASCIRMRPKDVRADREVVFLHGGAYCLMSAMTHHRFGGHVANAVKADVIIPDYALAPEAPYPIARDECLAVVQDRLAAGPGHCILVGDSAGGGLALSGRIDAAGRWSLTYARGADRGARAPAPDGRFTLILLDGAGEELYREPLSVSLLSHSDEAGWAARTPVPESTVRDVVIVDAQGVEVLRAAVPVLE